MSDRNPFAPPLAMEDVQHVAGAKAALCRHGNLLVLRNGASLPQICFVSGKSSQVTFDWKTTFVPRWSYGLLLLGIIPYFILGPIWQQSITIRLPLARAYLEEIHQRNRLVKGLYLAFAFFLFAMQLDFADDLFSVIFMVLGVSCCLIAFCLRKGAYSLGLYVVTLHDGELWLAGVHPDVLRDLPEY